ncbi:hypothetical protein SNOG_03067 [Parastagonospora nodorum SN15]|uniref:Transcription factor domain-containing protein n=1 Tax=Phaeosphaeria nodorum (strain SN15 / ATCC MYA-4574 / FGSC 10173) TaxID=321614 RepID=Q0UYU7_PHANO|nr:hypothetical protein SNOG_03067 [Parastagonospora nodorum SN15]EAT89798.2 hypothetical protein SNOG_03067 [Parastagonospora nodorum SN15]
MADPDAPAHKRLPPEPVDVKPQLNMEHGSHPTPWSVNQDHRSNGSVSSGYNPTISPPHPNDVAYHAPPPPGQPYGQPAPYGAPSPYLGQYSAQQAQVRRKQVRATQACNHCRARKQKENNFDCQYKDVPPPNMTDVLTNFIGEFGAWRQDVESRLPPRRAFENTSNMASPDNTVPAPPRDQSTSRMPTPAQGRNQSLRVNGMKMESPMVPYMSPGHAQASTPIKQEALLLGSQQPATPADSVRTDMSRTTDAGLQDKAGLQSDHTTPAHKLLEDWSAMQDWYKLSDYLITQCNWNKREGFYVRGVTEKDETLTMEPRSIPEDWDRMGALNFRVATMDKLLESYERNMHNLHPFFNRSKLQKMFREFKEQYSPDFKGPNIASPATHQVSLGMKRKRSSSAIHEQYPKAAIERSLRNAIVLLVLALGKVCSYKTKDKPLPSPESDKTHTKNAWGDGSFHSDTDDPRPRNIDLMPGMAYYSYATDILGNHHGGLTIAHAQAFILAALYISQFARVLESWSWINSACRITIVLLKADLNKLRREWYLSGEANKVLTPKERYKLDLVLFVYWTCLQLESQIYLRVIMNEAHNQLYGSKSRSFDENDPKAVAVHVNYHMEVLRSWKSMLLGQLQWNDTDPPSTDRNHARLRAKYYGGLYMMLRPYLRLAVLTEWPPSHQRQPHTWTHQSSPAVNGGMDRAAPIVDLTPDQKEMIKLACICIEAAIRSTIAFDRIGAPEGSRYEDYKSTRTERLVLTNIFGTMHAQFGNMLVLAAVYRSSIYQHLPANTPLTPRALDALFARTIEALSETAPNSPILKVDLDVLINLREKLELPKF